MKKTLAILLALCMLLGLVPAMAEVNLAGTYALDAAPLGMPMTVYLIVKEDNTFLLTNKLEGGAEKGTGIHPARPEPALLHQRSLRCGFLLPQR